MFKTGSSVPESGVYRVIHEDHRLPSEVTLISGQIFPRCAKCDGAVQFETIRLAPELSKIREQIIIYVLPAYEDEQREAPSGWNPKLA